jgi:hypothetical protein
MLPYKLDSELGARHPTLTVEQKKTALKFSATVGNATTNYLIKSVNISVKNMYLQVSVTRKKYLLLLSYTLLNFFLCF